MKGAVCVMMRQSSNLHYGKTGAVLHQYCISIVHRVYHVIIVGKMFVLLFLVASSQDKVLMIIIEIFINLNCTAIRLTRFLQSYLMRIYFAAYFAYF